MEGAWYHFRPYPFSHLATERWVTQAAKIYVGSLSMRFIVALIVGLIILDGASCTSSSRTMSAAEKKAIQTAKQWAIAQGLDPRRLVDPR
jgi:hypothetical protein